LADADNPGSDGNLGGPRGSGGLTRAVRMVGTRAAVWLTVGSAGGLLIAATDFVFALIIVALLRGLGLASAQIQEQGGPLALPPLSPLALALLLLLAGLIRAATASLVIHAAAIGNQLLSNRLKLLAIHELAEGRSSFLSISRIHSLFGEIIPKASLFTRYFGLTISSLIQTLALGAAMVYVAPRDAIIALVSLLVVGLITTRMFRRVTELARSVPRDHEAMTRGITRVTRNFLLLRALRTLDVERAALNRHLFSYSDAAMRSSVVGATAASLPQLLGTLILIGVILAQLYAPRYSGTAFIQFLFLFLRLTQGLALVAQQGGTVSGLQPQFDEAARFFDSFSEADIAAALAHDDAGAVREHAAEPLHRERSEPTPPPIAVEGLQYRYAADDRDVFAQPLSLHVAAGEQLAVLGRSGSGKSTLLALLLGVIRPSAGRILVGDSGPDAYGERNADAVAYVGADPYLIGGTVRENLLYGNRARVSEEELHRALGDVQLDDWVARAPRGLDTLISETGEGLSTGQKQRLALARALLRRPSLLILDEISANLDMETERGIRALILTFRGRCTTVVVTHREGLVEGIADRVHLD
jgi:ABC-type multidrug transport system fused ATPase/permease subunit